MTSRPGWTAEGQVLLGGRAEGECLVLAAPFSFWGGLDVASGLIIDAHHPQRGAAVRGRVLVMPHGRGSSSSSSVLAEAIRQGTGPAALLLAEKDEIAVLGALVVQMLDGVTCPVIVLGADDYRRIGSGDRAAVEPSGRVTVQPMSLPAGEL